MNKYAMVCLSGCAGVFFDKREDAIDAWVQHTTDHHEAVLLSKGAYKLNDKAAGYAKVVTAPRP